MSRDSELTPIVLENGSVVVWGWSYIQCNAERYEMSAPGEKR